MDILIGYQSALDFWRLVGPDFLCGYRARLSATHRGCVAMQAGQKPRLREGNRRPGGCSLPVHVLVGDASARTETASVVSHTWSVLPEKSLIDVGEGFLVSSPEFCFLHMAGRMTLAQLIQLGFELCGTYALAEEGSAKRRELPLTSVSKLRSFVECASRAYGRARALRALRYVQNGSASPMETILTMLLCLPYSMGGYGLEWPMLNCRIDVPKNARKSASKSYCECDLFWPSANLVVEYDSDLWHTGADRIARDSKRRNTLVGMGVSVVTVTSAQVMDGGELNKVAHLLAKSTSKRLRYKDPGFTRQHYKLRAELFEVLHEGAY